MVAERSDGHGAGADDHNGCNLALVASVPANAIKIMMMTLVVSAALRQRQRPIEPTAESNIVRKDQNVNVNEAK